MVKPTRASKPRQLHALILSGSGADGAYQVGVLKALLNGRSPATEKRPIDPRVVAATSTGALNACLLVSHDEDDEEPAVRRLERIWRELLPWNRYVNGSFRLRLNPLELLDPRTYKKGPGPALRRLWGDLLDLGATVTARAEKLWNERDKLFDQLAESFDLSILVGTEPWEETIAEAIDFDRVHASRQRLTISTADWKSGKVRHFVNRRGGDAVTPAVVRAACSVPGVHGPEAVDGELHVDGESQMISPLKPAIDQLHDIAASEPGEYELHLHVVYMSAKNDAMPATALESILQTLYGSQVINWTSKIDQDVEQARSINQGIVLIEDLAALHQYEEEGSRGSETEAIRRIRERLVRMPPRERQGLLTAARRIRQRLEEGTEWNKLIIHRYFPAQGLDGTLGFLDFRRSRLDNLIRRGFDDTVAHDCEANHCVLIEPARPASGQPQARRTSVKRHSHALILSGGGAYGAYQVGVAKALFEGRSPSTKEQPLSPEVFAGTSIGAFNASYLVSKWNGSGAEAAASLERDWLEHMAWKRGTNGAFRVRLNVLDWLSAEALGGGSSRPFRYLSSDVRHLLEQIEARGQKLFQPGDPWLERLARFFDLSVFVAAEPWEETIRKLVDFEEIRQSSRRLTIAATDWTGGELLHFSNRDAAENRRVTPEAVRASSAVPGFYPPATVDGRTCVDGAVLMNTPLKPAIEELRTLAAQGDESEFDLHVVYMSGKIESTSTSQGTLQTLFRSQAIHWGATVERDIEHARVLNQGLTLLIDWVIELGKQSGEKLSKKEIATVRKLVEARSKSEGSALFETADKILQRREVDRPYKQLTIHRYFPRRRLGGVLEFLDVRRSTIEDLIRQGYEDTVHHDCQANGCVPAIVPVSEESG